jgi:LysR family glycine cleavage system transcriptional activator
MTLSAAENGLGMCLESTVLVQEYLQQGKLLCPFGDMAIPIKAHHLAVPKSKERLQTVQVVLEWIRSFLREENSAVTAPAAQPGTVQSR